MYFCKLTKLIRLQNILPKIEFKIKYKKYIAWNKYYKKNNLRIERKIKIKCGQIKVRERIRKYRIYIYRVYKKVERDRRIELKIWRGRGDVYIERMLI